MRKSLKWLGAFICILILLVILALVCVVTFVSPNRFKPLIAEQVMKYTGRKLTFEGDLSWSFFPYLGVKTGHLVLSNPTGFEQNIFAEIQHATISVKLFPLLNKKIESNGIVLDGLKLNLIKEANGKNNWQFQQPSSAAASSATTSYANGSMLKLPMGLAVSGIEVINSEINWIDKQKNQSGIIDKLNLQAKNIGFLKPFPLSCEFNFINKNPALSGHVKFTSDTSLSVDQQIFSFRNLVLTTQLQQHDKKMHWRLTGDVIMDLQQQTLQWNHFHGQMSDLNVVGNIGVVSLITNPYTSGHLQIQPFDLKALLQEMGQDTANVQMIKDMSGDVDFTAAANAINVQGKFKINTIIANQIKLTNVIVPMHYQIGILELSPVTADFYQGSLQSTVKVNLTGSVSQIAMQSNLSNVQMQPLLQDMGGSNQKLQLMGMGNIELNITTLGNSSNAIVKNLSGTGHFSLNHGILQGLDIGYLIDSAYSILKHTPLTTTNTEKTSFDNLAGNLVFRDGVMGNDDLLLTSARFKTDGKGTIDLVNQKIDYHLQTLLNPAAADQKNNLENIYGLPIPINIVGNLKDPSIRLDMDVLGKAIANQQIKKIEMKVQDQIKNKISGRAGEMIQNFLGH